MEERILDARGLEPPEPLALTLEALGTLPKGACLRLLIHRVPHMLYPVLEEWGYDQETLPREDGSYEVVIRHRMSGSTEGA